MGGDPAHRKIEFDGKCDAMHQEYGCAKHDYGNVLMSFGFLLNDTDVYEPQLSKKAIAEERGVLFANRHIAAGDTYSALQPKALLRWITPPSLECTRRMFPDAMRVRGK